MPLVVAQGETDEGGARVRIGVGGALAGEIGQEQQPLAARLRGRRLVRDQLVRIAAQRPRHRRLRVAARVPIPAQRAAGGEHHSHHVPLLRHRVAEGVYAQSRIDRRPLCEREDDTRGADG